MNFKILTLAIAFYIGESFSSSLFSGIYNSILLIFNPTRQIPSFMRETFGVFGLRIMLLQALVEVIAVFIVIKYVGTEKFWPFLLAVSISVILWVVVFGSGIDNLLEIAKLVLIKHGFFIIIGALLSWAIFFKILQIKI